MKIGTAFMAMIALISATLSTAQAASVPARITYLNCGGFQVGVGGVSVIYNGGGFTITETNAYGIPLISQHATIRNVVSRSGRDIEFTLFGTITRMIYTIEVESDSGRARGYSDLGSMDLLCVGDIRAI